jgi:precorrin-3B synthase
MESGDGFIVRMNPGWRGRSSAEVRALVALARDHGNGQIEVTRRANWQLRGVTSGALSSLQSELARLGLAESADGTAEAVSLLVNPLSGLDAGCAPLEAVAGAVERALRSGAAPRNLPAKFGVVLDGGGDLLAGVAADIRVDLRPTEPRVAQLSVDTSREEALPLGACRAEDAATAVLALLELAAHGAAGPRRMRDVIDAHGVEAVRRALKGLLVEAAAPTFSARAASPVIGFLRGLRNWVGLGLPFGSGGGQQWGAMAEIAARFGDGTLRLTPRRSVIIAGVDERDRESVLAAARESDLVVDEGDPRLRITACVGAPSCSAARGETRAFARDIARDVAPLLLAGGTLHVSGCAKSCAESGPSTLTVVCDERGYRIARERDVAGTADADVLPREAARRALAAMALDPARERPRS